MAKRRNFTPEFKAEVVLEALCGQSSQADSVANITSAMFNSQSGNANFLKMRQPSLNLLISRRMRLRSVLLNLNNLLVN